MGLDSRLGDLREGRCSYGFFYNQVACCSGLDRMSFTPFVQLKLNVNPNLKPARFVPNGSLGPSTSTFVLFLGNPYFSRLYTLHWQ